MTRLLHLFLSVALTASPILAQQDRPAPPIPITGRVVNDATGDPIAGAVVRYRGRGLSFWGTELKSPYDPPSIQGQVISGADGTYTTPPLPADGNFMVRASAPGFLAAQQTLQALPENVRNSAPPGFPPLKDGILRLRPDPLGLTPMSDSALAVFALPHPGVANREYRAAAFSSDGTRLAFFTLDTFAPPVMNGTVQPPFQRCVAWIYDLKSDTLSAVDEHEEQSACDATAIAWDGNAFYTNAFPYLNSQTGSPPVAERVQANNARGLPPTILPLTSLPLSIQDQFQRKAAQSDLAQQLGGSPGAVTPDGHFSISVDAEGRSICGSLIVTDLQNRRKHNLGDACIEASFMMPGGDLVLYNDAGVTRSGRTNRVVAYDLKTGANRSFNLPGADSVAELLASRTMGSGAIRVAYSIHGDCDPAASDYSQPFQPDNVLGQTPNQFSVCFITLPAPSPGTAPHAASSPRPPH